MPLETHAQDNWKSSHRLSNDLNVLFANCVFPILIVGATHKGTEVSPLTVINLTRYLPFRIKPKITQSPSDYTEKVAPSINTSPENSRTLQARNMNKKPSQAALMNPNINR